MRIPHEFTPGNLIQHNLLTEEAEPACEVCSYVRSDWRHSPPGTANETTTCLGELYDFVVDNVMIGKIPAPANGLLSRCSKVLSR
jgi:hypothetical protein